MPASRSRAAPDGRQSILAAAAAQGTPSGRSLQRLPLRGWKRSELATARNRAVAQKKSPAEAGLKSPQGEFNHVLSRASGVTSFRHLHYLAGSSDWRPDYSCLAADPDRRPAAEISPRPVRSWTVDHSGCPASCSSHFDWQAAAAESCRSGRWGIGFRSGCRPPCSGCPAAVGWRCRPGRWSTRGFHFGYPAARTHSTPPVRWVSIRPFAWKPCWRWKLINACVVPRPSTPSGSPR